MFYQEHHIQEAVVNWVKYQYPDIAFTCAPGNAKNALQGVRNKKMGYCKGWPDLFFARPSNGYYGLFIELKTDKGKLDKESQEPLLKKLNDLGYKAVVCRSFEEAEKIIKNYLD